MQPWTEDDRRRDDERSHEQAIRRVVAAAARLEADHTEAARTNRDGWPAYSQAERQQREADAAEAFEAAMREEDEGLTIQIQRFERNAKQLADRQDNPLSRLPTDLVARAAALRPFVEADIRRLSNRDLVDQVDAIVASRDQGTMAAWHHVLLARAGEVDGEQGVLYQAAVEKLGAGLQDPSITQQQQALATRLDRARTAQRDLAEVARPVRTANTRAGLRADPRYASL